jgi:hypothetical protein
MTFTKKELKLITESLDFTLGNSSDETTHVKLLKKLYKHFGKDWEEWGAIGIQESLKTKEK